ncbi:MAG: hypothetical protein MUP53_05570, partial [Bacteroidales bacterium]|nr:hypothetical protein [Bacteroidales bacterium]
MRNSLMSFACFAAILALLAVPVQLFAKGSVHIMGNQIVTEEVPDDTEEEPVDTIDGPLLDKMSDSGALYGDLYMLNRYKGGETKKVPLFD